MATASSCPGSVSMMIGRAMAGGYSRASRSAISAAVGIEA
jgi:hypothetical protein